MSTSPEAKQAAEDRDELVYQAWLAFKTKHPTLSDSARQVLFYNGWHTGYNAATAKLREYYEGRMTTD